MTGSRSPIEILSQLQSEVDSIAAAASAAPPSSVARKKLDRGLRDLASRIQSLLGSLDPIRQPTSVFDPSDPRIIGRFVALALVAQERAKMSAMAGFYGSGVYAIYYRGSFPLYAPISGTETPIYVGKASPKVSNAKTAFDQGAQLSARLLEHARNIERAQTTLSIEDFECRALVVQSGWEAAAESYLIHLFAPIWNNETKILYGLGKHGDDANTRANKRSPWDTLHPGRKWAAASTQDARTPAQISADLTQHFQAKPIFANIGQVLEAFISELRQV